MTDQEALALKVGDRVEAKYGYKEWRVVTVTKVVVASESGMYLLVGSNDPRFLKAGELRYVECKPYKSASNRAPWVYRRPSQLRPCAEHDRAHVYADYLEEMGESRAADLLRKRFPL